MSHGWMPGVCNETAGFLFKHDCDRPPLTDCHECGKPVCDLHQREVDGRVLCIKCAGGAVRGSSSSTRFRRSGGRYHDDHLWYHDPYFYGGYHYDGYYDDWDDAPYAEIAADDPNDFTDADGAPLMEEGDEDFENDMDES
ncbi:MAG: hypothetical protein QGG36_09935 [Pirellulaceae bacterium]|jgi:hypothetical protein|nr:hypothetical protein [Pirellulaceae bacterium]MDP7016109.1 hypothetical protein [Pirellulaceae bacterium]